MEDVAEAAQVSLKTVSRVVNDEPGVTPETAERVHVEVDRARADRVAADEGHGRAPVAMQQRAHHEDGDAVDARERDRDLA